MRSKIKDRIICADGLYGGVPFTLDFFATFCIKTKSSAVAPLPVRGQERMVTLKTPCI